jgi:hypothetical protein
MTYLENAAQVARESDIAVQVLLSRENTDLELIPLRPRLDAYIGPQEFTARQLRSVAVVGIRGLQPLSVWKEPLPLQVINGVGNAFIEYIRVLLGKSLADLYEAAQAAEIAELERLFFCIPDARPN